MNERPCGSHDTTSCGDFSRISHSFCRNAGMAAVGADDATARLASWTMRLVTGRSMFSYSRSAGVWVSEAPPVRVRRDARSDERVERPVSGAVLSLRDVDARAAARRRLLCLVGPAATGSSTTSSVVERPPATQASAATPSSLTRTPTGPSLSASASASAPGLSGRRRLLRRELARRVPGRPVLPGLTLGLLVIWFTARRPRPRHRAGPLRSPSWRASSGFLGQGRERRLQSPSSARTAGPGARAERNRRLARGSTAQIGVWQPVLRPAAAG
mmetsp:Transcript_61831/g.149703  ORF Transcript_61831/g.149703 Transcript_61831/m.149703 type:complete len:272 (+) Transcript_61831:850-1665(+)